LRFIGARRTASAESMRCCHAQMVRRFSIFRDAARPCCAAHIHAVNMPTKTQKPTGEAEIAASNVISHLQHRMSSGACRAGANPPKG
jgi:hypothetical protein